MKYIYRGKVLADGKPAYNWAVIGGSGDDIKVYALRKHFDHARSECNRLISKGEDVRLVPLEAEA